ncbi:MAG: M28 family peptidase [Alphaproteobacteria bacterium]|nr:M28 family peptidase [Alphaproteobacteria bacterium]
MTALDKLNPIERDIVSQASTDEPWQLVLDFSTMHRWMPEDVNKGVDHLVGKLKALGIPVEVHEPELNLSIPIKAEVRCGGKTFRAKSPSSSVPTPQGLTGRLVYLPSNAKNIRSFSRDFRSLFGDAVKSIEEAKAMVKDAIVMVNGYANPANTSFLEAWGARGVIGINPGVDIHWGSGTTVWGNPDLEDVERRPKIAFVNVNKPSGEALIELAKKGENATIVGDLLIGWYPQKIPVVHIPGAVEPEKFVLVHGHIDSWEVGVGDNATGDATLMELARVLWNNRQKLRRSVRIAWWPGHSTGRYAGSTWYSDHAALDLDANCVAHVNCDSPGCRWATSYHETTVMSETRNVAFGAIRDVTGQEPKGKRPNQAGDCSFNNIGISTWFMLSSTMTDEKKKEVGYYAVSGCGGNIAWHTENDTLEIADRDILLTDIRIYLLSVLRAANTEFLPLDWSETVKEFQGHIDRYQQAAGNRYDLSPARKACESLGAALGKLQAGIVARKVPADKANEAILRLSRILVPINFTRQPRFRHDPAFSVPALPTLQPAVLLAEHEADQDMTNIIKTSLLRGQNRFIAAMREAEATVARAMA